MKCYATRSWRRLLSLAVPLAGAVLSAPLARAQGTPIFTEDQKIVPFNATAGERMGYAVSVHGDVLVSGAAFASTGGHTYTGAAYIYRFNGTDWIQEAKIVHPEPTTEGFFGLAVAIQEDVAVICSREDSNPVDGYGAAYIYRYNELTTIWELEQKLVINDSVQRAGFGFSVAMDGDLIVVGAYLEDGLFDATGACYVFRYNGSSWGLEARLSGAAATKGQCQGWSLDVDDDCVILGSNMEYYYGQGTQNRVFIFRHSGAGWTEEAMLDSQPDWEAWYGRTVAIKGDTAVVGSADDGSDNYRGSAYVYNFDGNDWNLATVLSPLDLQDNDYFGEVVVVPHERTVVVESAGHQIPGYGWSTIYIYHEDDGIWTESSRLTTANPNEGFAIISPNLSAHGGRLIVGAPNDDQIGNNAGAAFYFSLSCTEDLNGNGFVDQPDLGILLASYEVDAGGDIDGDGMTGQSDLGLLLAAYETFCK